MSYPDIFVAGDQVLAADLNDQVMNKVRTYGETLAAGDVVYLKASDSKIYKLDADVIAHVLAFVGVVVTAGAADETHRILGPGKEVIGLSGLTAGSPVYASNTAGGYSTSEGTLVLQIGIAVSTTAMILTPGWKSMQRIAEQGLGLGTSGEALAVGEPVYLKASDSKLYRTDADADESTYSFCGIAQSVAAGADESVVFAKPGGIAKGLSGLTAGSYYFLSGTVGTIANAPHATRYAKVAQALSTTTVRVVEPKFVRKGTTAVTATGDTVVTLGFLPASVRVRCGRNLGGAGNFTSVGDDNNTCIRDTNGNTGTQSENLGRAIDIQNGSGTTQFAASIGSKTQTGFTFTVNTHPGTGETFTLQWEAESL